MGCSKKEEFTPAPLASGELYDDSVSPPTPLASGEVYNQFNLPPSPLARGELYERFFKKGRVFERNRIGSFYFDYLVSLFSSPEKGAISRLMAMPYEKHEESVDP